MILLIFPGFIGLIVCTILLLIKLITKKPKKKILIAYLLCFAMCVAALSSLSEETENNQTEPTTNQITEVTEAIAETTTIELIAGEAGKYGELFTMNKGTEAEETYYIYHIPAGTYTVTNIGEYMSQFNIYSDEIVVNDAGWEEVAEAFYVKVLNVGASDTFTIEDGQFIEIHEPAKFAIEQIG